jgi:DNA relaxase NicK
MTVLDVQVISESSTKYQGIVNVEFEGKRYNVPLDILTKSGKIFVQTKPGALVFLSEKDMEQALEEFEKNMDSASKEFEKKIEEVSRTVKE